MLVVKKFNRVSRPEESTYSAPVLKVEGSDDLEVLCPTSKVTGFPMSMQRAIRFITDDNSRLADILYQEIPTINASDQIDDTDKLRLLVSRLDSGSFAENDAVAEILGNIAKEFFPHADVEDVVKSAQIQFNKESDGSQIDV